MFLVKSNISQESAASSHNKQLCQGSVLTSGTFSRKPILGRGSVCFTYVNMCVLKRGSRRALIAVGQVPTKAVYG